MKIFDLNIEQILESWGLDFAVREIIANALDEQILTASQDIEIYKREDSWIIRDFGRGLRYIHLTQNENIEKLTNQYTIGKFGIGLKDALATFNRHKITVEINSKYNKITVSLYNKSGFEDISTLHAVISPAIALDMNGTEFKITGISDDEIEKAKKLFLKFSGNEILETTKFGQIVASRDKVKAIYINGVKVAEEENFLFSYNITNPNKAIKKALNRERSNVGRSAYTDVIKKILLNCEFQNNNIEKLLAKDLINLNSGLHHDELSWLDIQEHTIKILNNKGCYLFVTTAEALSYLAVLEQAALSGYELIIIPDNLKYRIINTLDLMGNPITHLEQFVNDYNNNFEFIFIDEADLKPNEQAIFKQTTLIINVLGLKFRNDFSVKIAIVMHKNLLNQNENTVYIDVPNKQIIIARSSLKDIKIYSKNLTNALISATTGFNNLTHGFENALLDLIGQLVPRLIV